MKVVILAGGYGTRLSEVTELRPKPMVEIGSRPILWHIMKHYHAYGFDDFVILCGYKAFMVKEYFINYAAHHCDVVVNTAKNEVQFSNNQAENWRVTLLDTGLNTMTGGRIKRAEAYLKDAPFLLTYGDGVADVNLNELVKFHKAKKATCTLTAIQAEGRFGVLQFSDADHVQKFSEKPRGDGSWINGGFFVCEPQIFDYLSEGDDTIFERAPLERLANENKLFAYRHDGFWKCMDTLRDKQQLDEMWEKGEARWRV